MSKEKTQFAVTVNADGNVIQNVILNYLSANGFRPEQKPNANYFTKYDAISGRRSFEYYINGNQVVILAYLGKFEKPKSLEGFVGAIPKQNYKDDIAVLLNELNKLNGANQNAGYAPAAAQGYAPAAAQGYDPAAASQMTQNTNVDAFTAHVNHRKDTFTIIGFIISIVGLVLSFFGIVYGFILYFFEFYCGFQGIHSNKKGLAITTIVLAGVSIVILIIEIVISAAMALH